MAPPTVGSKVHTRMILARVIGLITRYNATEVFWNILNSHLKKIENIFTLITYFIKCGMKLLIHFQTSAVNKPLKPHSDPWMYRMTVSWRHWSSQNDTVAWFCKWHEYIGFGSWKCDCHVTCFCSQLITKSGNKTTTLPWPNPCR